jgi:hypothetical protein
VAGTAGLGARKTPGRRPSAMRAAQDAATGRRPTPRAASQATRPRKRRPGADPPDGRHPKAC